MSRGKGLGVVWLIKVLHRVEDSILVAMLLAMIVMAVFQIMLRNLFGGGVVWGDEMVRVLVLWVGLLGAMVATRQKKHIRIDLASRYLPARAARFLGVFLDLFSAVVCLSLAWYGAAFVKTEIAFGGEAFGKVPVWMCEAIVPAAFLVMGLRFLLYALKNLISFIGGDLA